MGRLIWGFLLFSLAGAAYFWLNATLPGGEKRYEQYIRQAKDRSFTVGI